MIFTLWHIMVSSVAYILWAAWLALIGIGISLRIFHEVRERTAS